MLGAGVLVFNIGVYGVLLDSPDAPGAVAGAAAVTATRATAGRSVRSWRGLVLALLRAVGPATGAPFSGRLGRTPAGPGGFAAAARSPRGLTPTRRATPVDAGRGWRRAGQRSGMACQVTTGASVVRISAAVR